MWVRLNKLEPGACFWEHRDYTELNAKCKVRLHIPICTSPDSHFVFQDKAVHLETDTIGFCDLIRMCMGLSTAALSEFI